MLERDFYPLPKLAERWGCTVHDLLHLGIQDRAQICVNIYGMVSGVERVRIQTEAPEATPEDEPLTEEESREAEARDAAFERWKARTTKDMPHGVFELGHDELRFLDMPGAFPHELCEALKFDGGWWACKFDPPVSIGVKHLCVLHEEATRLQLEMFNSLFASQRALPVSGTDDGFYPRAIFPAAGMSKGAVSLIDAAVWLLGFECVSEVRSERDKTYFGRSMHEALEAVEIAVAMGELKATAVQTTRARRTHESLLEIIEPVAQAKGLEVSFNSGSHVYLVASEFKNWWAKKNYLAESASRSDPRGNDVTLWPKHTTKKLTALRLAAFRFWGENYDPNEPDTAPKNETVIEWLRQQHDIGATPAAEMASILRPDKLRTGPR